MTLYVTLNDDGTLALETDYGGSRSEVATDSPDGPTGWEWKDSWGVPKRTEALVGRAIENADSSALAIAIAKDAIIEDFVDDRYENSRIA
jgi:hypothetical protein